MEKLAQVSDQEVRIDFSLNCKCRANVVLTSLCTTSPLAFKVQTSSPHKFLVNPPTGLVPPSSSTTIQFILKPQNQLPPTFPRSPSDRFLIKTALFNPNSAESTHPHSVSVNSWLSSMSAAAATQDIKLKVAFVGPVLLRHAVSLGDTEAVKSLIKRQKNVVSQLGFDEAESILRVATDESGNPDSMVSLLVEAGLKTGVSGEEVLMAARRGDVKLLERLVQQSGGSLKSWFCDQYGLTALHVAAIKGYKDVVELLIECGMDMEWEDNEGHVPLHMAVEGGSFETVSVLVERGADVNVKTKSGATPLFLAKAMGYEEISSFLINRGGSLFVS